MEQKMADVGDPRQTEPTEEELDLRNADDMERGAPTITDLARVGARLTIRPPSQEERALLKTFAMGTKLEWLGTSLYVWQIHTVSKDLAPLLIKLEARPFTDHSMAAA
jgi:hypothetical protein